MEIKIGKLTIQQLKEIIFKHIRNNREEVITEPEIGGDCAVIKTKGDDVIYLSSDPITGATKSLGKLAIHINANDIATSGANPLGVMITILAPYGTKREELETIIKEAQGECDKLNMSILGGHTEITDAVNRIVVSVTAIGIGSKEELKDKKNVKPGDYLVITKGVGIEGTGIISTEREQALTERFGKDFVEGCKGYLEKTSVVKDGMIAKKFVKGMHDVTEGGLLGAIWEMSELYKLGCEIEYEKIDISEDIRKLTDYFSIDPLKLISSGTMLMCVGEDNLEGLLSELEKNSIKASVIGKLILENRKIMRKDGVDLEIDPPESDELYKVL